MKHFIISILLICLFQFELDAHPVHVSIANMEYKADSNLLEYSLQLNVEDFEALINNKYQTYLRFSDRDRLPLKEQEAIIDYTSTNFKLLGEAQSSINSEFIGWKLEGGFIWLFFCGYLEPGLTSCILSNQILLDLFPDQKNLVIFNNGNEEVGFEFNKVETRKRISFE